MLLKTVSKLNPEVVFFHLGQGDIWKKLEAETIAGYAKQMMWKLLVDTEVRICFSLLIPLNSSPQQKAAIEAVNESITYFITELRKNSNFGKRIFSMNNNTLGGYLKYSTGPNGKKVDLNEKGLSKFWLMMKDSLRRTLELAPLSTRTRSRTNSSRNRSNDE